MGFGAGSALTIIPIAAMIRHSGYEETFLRFGLGQGLLVFALAWFLRHPPAGFASLAPAPASTLPRGRDIGPGEMIRKPVFWVLYIMFVLMASGGLMATAQLAPIAGDMGVADVPVSLLGITLPALTFALSIDRVLNGATRPFFGWVSDRLGRENTMFIAFAAEAVGIMLLSRFGGNPVAFVLLSGLVFFAWGEIYSLFPATCADAFGAKHATANAGLLYTAKGTAALLVPLTSVMAASGGWRTVFAAAGAMNLVAAFAALLVLKPMRTRLQQHRMADAPGVLLQQGRAGE
jgi:OFA family oxalate/formate antiporter-like MFS transporter